MTAGGLWKTIKEKRGNESASPKVTCLRNYIEERCREDPRMESQYGRMDHYFI
jgi:hypothetical protein